MLDEDISKAVQKSIRLHQWYIIPETIPLALFDEGINNYEKDELAKKILSYPREEINKRTGTGFGKHTFPNKVLENYADVASSSDVWIF